MRIDKRKRWYKKIKSFFKGLVWGIIVIGCLLWGFHGEWIDTHIEPETSLKTQKNANESISKEEVEEIKAQVDYIYQKIEETPPEMIARIAKEEGLTDKEIKTILAVAQCESHYDDKMAGKNRNSIDRGLWQFNSYWYSQVSDECAFDAECSTREFIKYYKRGRIDDWVCFSTKKYLQYVK
jgi:hypothetical protein